VQNIADIYQHGEKKERDIEDMRLRCAAITSRRTSAADASAYWHTPNTLFRRPYAIYASHDTLMAIQSKETCRCRWSASHARQQYASSSHFFFFF
jgi:hypothetical protein